MTKDVEIQAFPRSASEMHINEYAPQKGMTLRDYFAASIMQGMLSRPKSIDPKHDAEFAYMMADAMLKARKETK